MCVGRDPESPYSRFYVKDGAVRNHPRFPLGNLAVLSNLASRLPRPAETLMTELRLKERRRGWGCHAGRMTCAMRLRERCAVPGGAVLAMS